MTNVQFITLLSTAVGSFVLVILAWINQNQRLGDLREDMNRQFGAVDSRLRDFRDETNRQFAAAEVRLRDFRDETNREFGRVEARLTLIETDQKDFFSVTGKLDGRIEQLSRVK